MEWLGIKPFTEDPKVFNPEQGYVTNWNNQAAPGAVSDGGNYGAVDRVNEIIARLEAEPRLSNEELWAIIRATAYADTNARYFVSFVPRRRRTSRAATRRGARRRSLRPGTWRTTTRRSRAATSARTRR